MNLEIDVGGGIGSVAGLLTRPQHARVLYLLAHGAGAGMRHPFMTGLVDALAAQGIASLRYQFPYMEAGRRRPDSPSVLEATVQAAVAVAQEIAPGLPLLAGGKSMGGRMTSNAAAHQLLPGVIGLVFVGFPLHPAGRPGQSRAEHLRRVDLPMLFLQGTRDTLADLGLIKAVCQDLAPRATLHVVEGGDHSFAVLKRSGRTEGEVMEELARTTAEWCQQLLTAASVRSPAAP
jgi:uncharacterized protein